MVISDRTKGCCSSDLNEPPHPNHDQFAELDAHNSLTLSAAPTRRPDAKTRVHERHAPASLVGLMSGLTALCITHVSTPPLETELETWPFWPQ